MKAPAQPRSRGRPKLSVEEETQPVTVRLTPSQRDKLKRLGGAPWVRMKIERAKEPKG